MTSINRASRSRLSSARFSRIKRGCCCRRPRSSLCSRRQPLGRRYSAGRADAAITSSIDAESIVARFPALIHLPSEQDRSKRPFGYIVAQGDFVWTNYLNNWITLKFSEGFFQSLKTKSSTTDADWRTLRSHRREPRNNAGRGACASGRRLLGWARVQLGLVRPFASLPRGQVNLEFLLSGLWPTISCIGRGARRIRADRRAGGNCWHEQAQGPAGPQSLLRRGRARSAGTCSGAVGLLRPARDIRHSVRYLCRRRAGARAQATVPFRLKYSAPASSRSRRVRLMELRALALTDFRSCAW